MIAGAAARRKQGFPLFLRVDANRNCGRDARFGYDLNSFAIAGKAPHAGLRFHPQERQPPRPLRRRRVERRRQGLGRHAPAPGPRLPRRLRHRHVQPGPRHPLRHPQQPAGRAGRARLRALAGHGEGAAGARPAPLQPGDAPSAGRVRRHRLLARLRADLHQRAQHARPRRPAAAQRPTARRTIRW